MIRPKYLIVILPTILYTGCAELERADDPAMLVREITNTRIESFLQEMVRDGHFNGVALVIQKGEIIHAKGYGAATSDTANYVTTAFHVASVTKQFTAAAIMQLVEKGLVELDGSVNEYLPLTYKSPKWDAVTIHHLLSHSSGITDYAITRDYYDVVNGFCLGDTVDGMVREAMEKDLEFMPGSKYSYTNLGYTLLGFVIENETNTAYNKYIQDNILDPMGMTSSTIHVIGHVPDEDEAEGYRWSEKQGEHVPDDVVSLPVTAPDGGLVTTLGDFAKWTQIYTGGEQNVLNQDSINKMSSPVIRIGRGGPLDSMGYGLYVGDRLIGHGGYIVGFRSQFILDRKTQTLFVIFSNNTATDPGQMASGLMTILWAPNS